MRSCGEILYFFSAWEKLAEMYKKDKKGLRTSRLNSRQGTPQNYVHCTKIEKSCKESSVLNNMSNFFLQLSVEMFVSHLLKKSLESMSVV